MTAPKKIPPVENKTESKNDVVNPLLTLKTNLRWSIKLNIIPVVALQKCAVTGVKTKRSTV